LTFFSEGKYPTKRNTGQAGVLSAVEQAYSPELNPDEQVWNQLKHHRIGKIFIKSLDDMVEKVGSALRSIQRTPALIRSFFQHRECRYAAE
jgi:transposase